MHKRPGDQSYPDEAISIEVMMALMARFETALEAAKGKEKEVAALFPALFSVVISVAVTEARKLRLWILASFGATCGGVFDKEIEPRYVSTDICYHCLPLKTIALTRAFA
jgi:hypothetical protein